MDEPRRQYGKRSESDKDKHYMISLVYGIEKKKERKVRRIGKEIRFGVTSLVLQMVKNLPAIQETWV